MKQKVSNNRKNSFAVGNHEAIEILPVLGCICCGSDHNLIPYNVDNFYSSLTRLNVYHPLQRLQINSDFVPVCLRCSIEFQRWIFFYSYFFKVKLYNVFIYLSSIIVIFTLISSHFWQFTCIALTTTCFFKVNFHLFKRIKNLNYNPHYFIYIHKNEVRLKHRWTQRWLKYDEWVKETIYYRLYIEEGNKIPTINYQNSDFTECYYCGAKVLKKDIKCVKCEQFLPLMD